MKKSILFGIFALSLSAFAVDNDKIENNQAKKHDFSFSIGGMVGKGSNLYHVDKGGIGASPVFTADYKGAYLVGTELGYKYDATPKLSITGFTQLFGGITLQGAGGALGGAQLKGSDMEDGYENINDRKTQVELGLKLDYQTDFHGVILSGEGRGGERGASGKVSALRPFLITSKFVIIPEMNFSVLGKNKVNYYFSVNQEEVDRDKNDKLTKTYDPNEMAYAVGFGFVAKYYITQHFSAVGLFEYQHVSDSV